MNNEADNHFQKTIVRKGLTHHEGLSGRGGPLILHDYSESERRQQFGLDPTLAFNPLLLNDYKVDVNARIRDLNTMVRVDKDGKN